MKTVTPFPYDSLPQLRLEELAFKKRLQSVYQYADKSESLWQLALQTLKEMLPGAISLKLKSADIITIQGALGGFGEHDMIATLRCDPLGKRGFVNFDNALTQYLINHLLSGGKQTPESHTDIQVRPLSVLQEAVVQYIIVDLLERLTSQLPKKNFSISFDTILRDSQKLAGLYTPQDQLVLFFVKLTWEKRDFYLKVALPLPIVDKFDLPKHNEDSLKQRLRELGHFCVDMQLEVAEVSLFATDLNQLEVGDILFFDESRIQIENGQISGKAKLVLSEPHQDEGYLVDLTVDKEKIRAEVESIY